MSLLDREEAKLLLGDATLEASTVRGCRQRLTGFLQRYLPFFYRAEQRGHAELVIRGRLSHLDRKTCEPIARQAGVQRKPVQQFVGGGKWDDEAVMGELRRHVAESLRDPDATFVLDGSAFPKKGTESCGVQRQWCGRLGKVDNCQVGVFLSCVSEGRAGPLGRRLYLPHSWAENTARRRKCHVPHSVRFAEKWQLGLKLIEQAQDVPHGWIVADDEFGRVSQFRAKLRRRRQRYVLDVPCDTLIRTRVVVSPLASPGGKRKAQGKKKRGRPRLPPWVRVETWARQQPAARWQRIEVRPGEKRPLVVEVLHAAVELRDKSQERLLVIRTVEAEPKTHYCLSNAAASVPVDEIVWAHDDRHRIEEMFALGNGEVGLDHYEVRSWVGWHHHMTLSLLGLWFLVLERQRVGEKNTGDHRATSAADLQPSPPAARAHSGQDRRNRHERPATHRRVSHLPLVC
jgi:SRSO17 transposase